MIIPRGIQRRWCRLGPLHAREAGLSYTTSVGLLAGLVGLGMAVLIATLFYLRRPGRRRRGKGGTDCHRSRRDPPTNECREQAGPARPVAAGPGPPLPPLGPAAPKSSAAPRPQSQNFSRRGPNTQLTIDVSAASPRRSLAAGAGDAGAAAAAAEEGDEEAASSPTTAEIMAQFQFPRRWRHDGDVDDGADNVGGDKKAGRRSRTPSAEIGIAL